MSKPDLEQDILANDRMRTRAQQDATFAVDLYGALCNTEYVRIDGGETAGYFGCSWRYAGGLVARLVGAGDYMTYYCSGNEAHVTDEISTFMSEMGWRLRDGVPYEDYK